MAAPRAKIIASVVVILLSVGSLYFTVLPSPPAANLLPHEGLGSALGQLAAKSPSGGKIVLIAPDTSVFPNPHIDAQVKAFVRELRAANLAVAVTNRIKLDPLRLVRVPPGDFAQWLKKLTEKDVVVSLMGPPVLTEDQRSKLTGKLPRIIAVCSGDMPKQVPIKRIMETGLLETAVISRHSTFNVGAASSAQDAFDRAFQVITAANVAELPVPANAGL